MSHHEDPRAVPLILASGSPRRRKLLADAGYVFDVVPPHNAAEEEAPALEDPAELVLELARHKVADVAQRIERGILIAADTVAECEGQILGKPRDRNDAGRMLRLLQNSRHRVLTGVCVLKIPDGRRMESVVVTTLRMDPLNQSQIDVYLDSGRWQGKAGGFGFQDRLGWIHIEQGSESNVVGLPMEELKRLLAEIGYRGPGVST